MWTDLRSSESNRLIAATRIWVIWELNPKRALRIL